MAKGGRWSDSRGVEVRDMRDAETTLVIIRADWIATTGEPDAVKIASPVRRGADGKGAGGAT